MAGGAGDHPGGEHANTHHPHVMGRTGGQQTIEVLARPDRSRRMGGAGVEDVEIDLGGVHPAAGHNRLQSRRVTQRGDTRISAESGAPQPVEDI